MGKTVGTGLKIAGAAALLATGVGIPGSVTFLAGTSFAFTTSLALAGTTALLAGNLLDPPTTPDFAGEQSQNLRLSKDPNASRMLFFGESAAAGTLVFNDTIGGQNEDLWMVIAVAGHEINGFTKFEWAGEEVTFSSNNAVGKYHDKMFLYDLNGTDSQAALPELVAVTAKWTTNSRLRGIAYYALKLVYDAELFASGVQQIRRNLEGAKVYDPRLDSTQTDIPGSGIQRADDQTTWTYSNNPVLCLASYMLGYTQNGILIFGVGIDKDTIDWVNFAAQADICDQNVSLKGGGTEKRYTCNGFIDPKMNHEQARDRILGSMSGTLIPPRDLWRCYAAAPTPAVHSHGDNEFLSIEYTRIEKSISEKFNSVKGAIADKDSRYEIRDVPVFTNSTYLAEDGGSEEWMTADLSMITSMSQGQRVLRIYLNRSRMGKQIAFSLNAIGLKDTAMDTINVSYAPFNLSSNKMRITNFALRFTEFGMYVEEIAQEEDDSIYDWDETTDEQTPIPALSTTRVATEPTPASFVESDSGLGGEDIFNRVEGTIANTTQLRATTNIDQGDGEGRVLPRGSTGGTAFDAVAVTFTDPWSSGDIPDVDFTSGGVSSETTFTNEPETVFSSLNKSTTGFTPSLRLIELDTGTTPVVDTGAVEVVVDADWQMDKSTATEANNDQYTFQFDVRVNNIFDGEIGQYFPGSVSVGIYVNTGGGFFQADTLLVTGSGGTATTVRNNQTKVITVDGLGQIAGKEFRVLRESSSDSGDITNFDSVSFDIGGTGGNVTATPAGSLGVQFTLNGGNESGVS